ncbi:MAG TPA: hypothetical protein VFQ67_07935 [Allosphingosinicella sp.]|jgi:uncharacterized membrane protein|nr:hypothetical protein [Allosphingosinicella sp.]
MRTILLLAASAALLTACGSRGDGPAAAPANDSEPAPGGNEAGAAPAGTGGDKPVGRWDLQSSGEGVALVLGGPERPAIRFFCPAGGKSLLVNVPAFKAVGSEERLSFGSGGESAALVADSRGDRKRGGVSATGAVPEDLAALVGGPVSASYGAQRSGPHPPPPQALSAAFVAACREVDAAAAEPAPGAAKPASPCLVQDGKAVSVAPLRALGTEPFWNARVEGRCVTYSHPEDQKGSRVWTRFTPAPGGGTWSGSLGGRPFELRVRPKRGCSDGMSDRRYPLAAELLVAGERRTGCAEPA